MIWIKALETKVLLKLPQKNIPLFFFEEARYRYFCKTCYYYNNSQL
jgi:hypothetical protein